MYDLIILGAGPGGYYLAERIGKKKKTLIIEKDKFGGTCLNVGCIPSKAILYSRKIFSYTKHARQYGIDVKNPLFKHEEVIKRKDEKVRILVNGVEAAVKNQGVDIIKGEGKILEKKDNIFNIVVNEKIYQGKTLVIATGSKAMIPPIKGLQEVLKYRNILTNVEIFSLKKVPDKLIIIGAGVIGLEMAAYFESLGKELHVIEFQGYIAGPTDRELSNLLFDYYKKKKITFHLNCLVEEIKKDKIIVKNRKTNQTFELKYDKLLLATGRIPLIENIGLENIKVFIEKNRIKVDKKCLTNVSNCYAIGDVNGELMLAHTAYRQADVVFSQLMGKTYDVVDYNSIPSVIYTSPEVASVGYTEEKLKQEKIEYSIRKKPLLYSGRFLAEIDDFSGLMKILIEKDTKTILGIHIIGTYASEIIGSASIILAKKMTIELLKDVVFPHPTVAEILRDLIMEEK